MRSAMLTILIEAVGWAGAVTSLASYALLSAGRRTAASPAYQWMNIIGAAGFVVNSGWNGAMPSAVLNVIWMGIGVAALWRLRTARRRQA